MDEASERRLYILSLLKSLKINNSSLTLDDLESFKIIRDEEEYTNFHKDFKRLQSQKYVVTIPNPESSLDPYVDITPKGLKIVRDLGYYD